MYGLVSVILPVYNVEKYIREALDSVINQTYKNLEIILVDDGSPDSSGDICDEYAAKDDRIRVIHKENGGVSSARNAGIEMAAGDWIYFMDPDDWIEPDTLEAAVGMAAENGCDMCMFDVEKVSRTRKTLRTFQCDGTVFRDPADEKVFLAFACVIGAVWNIVTKADFIKKLRFDESFSIREDDIFKLQLYGTINSFCHVRKPLYHYRCVSSSATNSFDLKKQNENNLRVYRKQIEIIKAPGYPSNAAAAIHSKYIQTYYSTCSGIFSVQKPLAKRIEDYKNYVTSKEFIESLADFTDICFPGYLKFTFRKRKAPSWLWAYTLVKIRYLRNIFKNKTKF